MTMHVKQAVCTHVPYTLLAESDVTELKISYFPLWSMCLYTIGMH